MKSFSQISNLSEEEYDKMRDRQLERGTWKSASSDKPRSGGSQPKPKGKTQLQKDADKKYGAGTSVMDRVKADITAKYGKGAIMNTKKEETTPFIEPRDGITSEGNKPGLWANIHAKRKRGEKPAKKGSKDYPKTLNVEAKVDAGSPEKKEADRNLRKFGVKGNEMAHGKLRRSLHKMSRGDKKVKGDKSQYVETEGYAPGDVDQKVGAVTSIPKKDQDDAKARILAKTKAKRAARLQKESVFDQVDIFLEMNDWEISLLTDTMIEDIITDVFIEELQEGRDIDHVTEMLCESVDYSLSLITEVSDSYYDKAAAASKAASRTPEVKAANRRVKLDKVKSAAKKVGSALKSGLKTGAKLARKGAVKGAEVAGKAAGHAKNLAKDMGSAAKSGYKSTQSSSSDKDSETTSSNPTTSSSSSDSSSSSSDSGPKKPGLLSRIGSKLKRGIKKAVGAGARSLSRGARNVARRLGEETIAERADMWHPDPEKDRKLGGPGANQRAREDRADAAKPKSDPKKLKKGESYMDYAKRQKGYTPPKKKEGLGDKIKRKLGMKREEVTTLSFSAFLSEGNRTARMMQKSKTQVTGHISADRGSDEKKNREGRKGLEKDLKKHGIGHKKGVGEYKYDSGETGREVSYQTSKPDKMSKRRFGKVMRRMGRKHGQESVITKDKDKSAKLHYTEKGSKAKSDSIGKTKAGKHPEGYGETSGTKARGGKLPKKTTKGAYHYG